MQHCRFYQFQPALDSIIGQQALRCIIDDQADEFIIDKLELLKSFIEKYKQDFADDIQVQFYVVNLTEAMTVEMSGIEFVLIPLTEGIAWNELVDELSMEKSDLKGQSPTEKIVTVYDEYKDHTPKYPAHEFNYAMTKTADIKWETHGAV